MLSVIRCKLSRLFSTPIIYSKRYWKRLISRNVNKMMICRDLEKIGIVAGDTIFMHSSLSRIGHVSGGANTVIEAIKEVISPSGNLIVPTYFMPSGTIYAASRQAATYCFDPSVHGTILGAIPSAFLKHGGIKRSLHPTHSVSAYGPDDDFIVDRHHLAGSACGIDTPWGRLVELEGKILGIGVSIAPVTFYHYLEDVEGDNFPEDLWLDPVHFKCKHRSGRIITVPVKPYRPSVNARRLEKSNRDDLRSFLQEDFLTNGILKEGSIGEADAWQMNSKELYEHLKTLMSYGITIYTSKEKLASYIGHRV